MLPTSRLTFRIQNSTDRRVLGLRVRCCPRAAITRSRPPLAESSLAYLGADTSRYTERSSVPGLITTVIPFMISSAEFDPPAIVEQFGTLKEAMCKSAHGCVRSIVLPHHSHMSAIWAIGTADTLLSDQILEFIKTAN